MKLIFIIFSLVSISSFSQNRSDIFLKQRVWKINSCVNDSLSLNQENIFLFYENKCCELNCKTENKQYFEPNVLIFNSDNNFEFNYNYRTEIAEIENQDTSFVTITNIKKGKWFYKTSPNILTLEILEDNWKQNYIFQITSEFLILKRE